MTPVTPTPDRAWVLLPSGRRLDLLTPDPDAWTDRDLAIGLSRTYRWGGHSRWDLPLSVAQHSLLVLAIRQRTNMLHTLTRAEALRELLHDADEGLLGFDPISPLKPHLGGGFKAVSDRLRTAIDTRYQLLPWSGDDYRVHKQADHLAAASEAFHVTGWPREAIRDSLQIQIEPVADDPLPLLDGMQPWEPWPPRIAAALFLAKLRELTSADGYVGHPGDLSAGVDRATTIQKSRGQLLPAAPSPAAPSHRSPHRQQPDRHLRLRGGPRRVAERRKRRGRRRARRRPPMELRRRFHDFHHRRGDARLPRAQLSCRRPVAQPTCPGLKCRRG